jgi:hypothetical protein
MMNQTKIKIISYLIASISIACLNKHLFNSLFFPIFDVTGFQLFATFISIFIGFEIGIIESNKTRSLKHILISTLLITIFHSSANRSLEFNTIQFSQSFKLIYIPINLALDLCLNKQNYSKIYKISCVCLVITIFVNSYFNDNDLYKDMHDVNTYNPQGLIYSSISAIAGSCYYIVSYIYYQVNGIVSKTGTNFSNFLRFFVQNL